MLELAFISLPSKHRAVFCQHLLRLDTAGRARRFGCAIAQAGIEVYVESWNPIAVFALVDEMGSWRGVVEIHPTEVGHAEIALSIESAYRGQGWGECLLNAATAWGRSKGLEGLDLTISTHNPQMTALARKAGAVGWKSLGGGATQACLAMS